jgi:hypothetical protein
MPMTTDELKKLVEDRGRILADIADFDGDRRGHYAALQRVDDQLEEMAPDLALEVIALRKAAEGVVKNHDAWQHSIDHADYGSESGAKREFGYAIAHLRAVLGENE